MFDYTLHNFNRDNFRVVMTILVRDEVDIIEMNIKTHSSLGVDAFVVMDNGSTDGTRELLSKLQGEFDITIIDESGEYSQAKWMKQLATVAKDRLGADWVISNDADEFWIPNNGLDIKENLAFKGSVLTVQRYNMLLHTEEFFNSIYYVDNPIFYSKEKQLTNPNISIVLTKIAPKTIINPHGLIYLRGGNHKALHSANIRDYLSSGYDKIKRFKPIEVFHYPIRSYEQFEKNIKNRKRLLESGRKVSMGPHYRRWVKLYSEGKLLDEFEKSIIFKQDDIDTLLKYGVVKRSDRVKLAIS